MANKAELARMAAALSHRGPDGEGFFTFLNLGLAHRRLSIIDLEGGRQPLEMKGAKAPVAAVVNGEIYNYIPLRNDLLAKGASLLTRSDSEPLLHLVAREGAEAWSRLSGMYAAAVADGRDGTLWLGVDPFGIKPLYYVETPRGLAFASEPRALVAAGWLSAEANPHALGGILNMHYARGDACLFAGVKRMLPGERMEVREGRIVRRWRQPPALDKARARLPMEEALREFEHRFTDAVRRHLQADVPYGVLLSGGLDSSAIVLTMAKLGVKVNAYTARFAREGDEDLAAADLARRVGARHTTVTYGAEDFWGGLGELAWTMDDLATDYSSLPLLKLMRTARADVKILLSGEGGDELLAGYRGYRASRFKVWMKGFRKGDATPYRALFRDKALAALPPDIAQPWNTKGFSLLQRRQGDDIAEWLPHDLLLRLDRVSMAHGIEGRVPFLDDDFAAWAFVLPDDLKVGAKDGKKPLGKWLVRQWLARQGHHDVAFGKKKGFSVPVGDYLAGRTPWLKELWEGNPLVGGQLLRKGAADRILRQLAHPKAANLAFTLTMLALWQRIHVEGAPPADALR